MSFMLLTPVNTKKNPEFAKMKVLINLSKINDIRQGEDGTILDFGGDEAVWTVEETLDDIVAQLRKADLLVNLLVND
jgi:hypothetical protein